MRRLLWLFLLAVPAYAQIDIPSFQFVSVAPSGACNGTTTIQVVYSTYAMWGCASGVWTQVNAAGGGGSGGVNPGNLGQYPFYFSTGSQVSGAPHYLIDSAMSLAQANTIFSQAGAAGVVDIIPYAPQLPYTNAAGTGVIDFRKGADWLYPARYGIVCDANQVYLSIAQGATQVQINSDVVTPGSTFIFSYRNGFGYGSLQQVWEPVSTTFAYPYMQLNGAAPFSYTGWVTVGTDNTAALNAAFADANYVFPLRIPAGCLALTQATAWTGTPIKGLQMNSSFLIGFPHQDIIQATRGAADTTGAGIQDLGFIMDFSQDPTLGYRKWNQAGTSYNDIAPLYRPTLNNTPDANRPLNDQWGTKLINGVASITAGSPVICVSNALGRTFTNTNRIIFPYLPTVFTTTILNQTGGGCASGFTGLTLNANIPTGDTAAQAYFESGTAFDTVTTAIPATGITYPLTITVSLPNAPDPNGTTAPWGHFIIGNSTTRIEADYMGNNYSAVAGSGTFILQKGPASMAAACAASACYIIPANPCAANFETPPPVFPNINGSSAETPVGAVDIPGGCVGNAAISFPEPDGTVPSTGTVNAFFERLFLMDTDNSLAQGNNGAMLYTQGNAGGYSDLWDSFKDGGSTYGIVQGPAGIHNWGIYSVGATLAGNTISNCQIHAGFPLVLYGFGQGKIDRCDTYTSLVNPYNGSTQGAATAIALSYTTNEQSGSGSGLPGCYEFGLYNWNSEPEGGNPKVVVFPYSYINCADYSIINDNFEGPYQVFAGMNGLVQNTQVAEPVINYGSNIKFENVYGMLASYMTNSWADTPNQFFNWGNYSSCSGSFGGGGAMGNCGVGFIQEWNGHDITQNGLDANGNIENALGGMIDPGERLGMLPPTVDPTEPYWGKYTACNLGSGAECIINQFDGFQGSIFIGGHNRISPTSYSLEMNSKSASASGQFQVQIAAYDSGSGQCSSPGAIISTTINTTTSWGHSSTPVNFTGKQGCILNLQFYNGTTSDAYEIGELNFVPQPAWVNGPTVSDSIEGTSCPVAGRMLGVSSGYQYWCAVGGTVKRVAIN